MPSSMKVRETYLIVIVKTSTGYSAHCPDVLGCAAVGKTLEEVVANMKKALELHFEGTVEDGEPIPKPGGVDSYQEAMKDLDVDLLGHVQIDTSRFSAQVTR
jgi:predicted RNase H-like HicB family nuclease